LLVVIYNYRFIITSNFIYGKHSYVKDKVMLSLCMLWRQGVEWRYKSTHF